MTASLSYRARGSCGRYRADHATSNILRLVTFAGVLQPQGCTGLEAGRKVEVAGSTRVVERLWSEVNFVTSLHHQGIMDGLWSVCRYIGAWMSPCLDHTRLPTRSYRIARAQLRVEDKHLQPTSVLKHSSSIMRETSIECVRA